MSSSGYSAAGSPDESAAELTCAWHPDRPTGLRCNRCGRPACAECLREAAVGHQCVDCVTIGRRSIRQGAATTLAHPGSRPVVVQTLIAVNVVVYAVTAVTAHSVLNNDQSHLSSLLALWPPAVAGGAWWQLVTSGFLHAGPLHIAMNMFALWIIGRELELVIGRWRFTAIYVVSLLGGSVSVFLFGAMTDSTVGASGAVFGIMGGLLVVVLRLKLNPGSVIAMIVINLVFSVAIPHISLLDHLGGLVIGALLTAAMVYAPTQPRLIWQLGAIAVAIVVLVGLVLVRDFQFGGFTCYFNQQPLRCVPG